MIWAVISFAATALAFAGAALALAIDANGSDKEASQHKAAAKEAQYNADEFQEQLIRVNELRGSDQEIIRSQKADIETLRKLLRENAPDGVAASWLDELLQEDSSEDGNEGNSGREEESH